MWDLFTLVKHSCEATKNKMSAIEIPVVVDYRDAHGTWYQSVNVLRYDWFLGTGNHQHRVSEKSLSHIRFAKAWTGPLGFFATRMISQSNPIPTTAPLSPPVFPFEPPSALGVPP